MQKHKNNEARPKFTGSYKKKKRVLYEEHTVVSCLFIKKNGKCSLRTLAKMLITFKSCFEKLIEKSACCIFFFNLKKL